LDNNREKDFEKPEDITMKVRLGTGHFQPVSQTTASILAGIKPLPPGILEGKTKKPEKEEKKIESKPAVDLYSIGKLPITPPIRPKKKSGKERGLKEEPETRPKKGLIPLQMATSISGQSLMFNQPVIKRPGQFPGTCQKVPESKASPISPAAESTEKKPSGSSLSLLKYISVSVKCRRLIYEKESFTNLMNDIEEYISGNGEDLIEEIRGNLKDYREVLSTEIIKVKEKGLPPGDDKDFKEARNTLIGAISSFKEGVEDLNISVVEEDMEIFEDAKESIENSFEEMNIYFEIREEIKSRLSSG